MAKHISMESNLRKKPNLHSPIEQHISKKPPTHAFSPLLNHRRKETSTSAKVEEPLPKNLALSSTNSDELLQTYPFVERPVVFNLGHGGYGDRLFLELQKEISYERSNYGSRPHLGAGVMETKYSREDIYDFSSEADMIASFFKDNLL